MVFDLVLIGSAIAVDPPPLTAFFVVLPSQRGVRKGAAFVFGWLVSMGIARLETPGGRLAAAPPLASVRHRLPRQLAWCRRRVDPRAPLGFGLTFTVSVGVLAAWALGAYGVAMIVVTFIALIGWAQPSCSSPPNPHQEPAPQVRRPTSLASVPGARISLLRPDPHLHSQP